MIINKKKKKKERSYRIVDFAVLADHSENQSKQKERQFLNLAREVKKGMEDESDGDNNWNWCTRSDPQNFGKGLEEMKIGGRAETIQTTAFSITANGQNTETRPWNLSRLAVIQTPGKDYQLTLMWKTCKK